MSGFLIAPGVLSPSACEALATTWSANSALFSQEPDPFWGNRVLRREAIRTSAPEVVGLMNLALKKAMGLIRMFYAEGALYCDTLDLVGWPAPHPGMPLHSDNAYADGSPHPLAHRAYSGVIYLTDDYGGGELLLPAQDCALKPPVGTLVSLPGGLTHQHGVAPVIHGFRVTLSFFLTRDPARETIR